MVNLRSDPRRWKHPKSTDKRVWWQTLSELRASSRKEFQQTLMDLEQMAVDFESNNKPQLAAEARSAAKKLRTEAESIFPHTGEKDDGSKERR